jgi:regulator of cell morphogenesis and NO signaling
MPFMKKYHMKKMNERTLGQFVTDNCRNTLVFEKYQMDFCCNGKRSLQVASSEKGIDATEIIKELTLIGESLRSCYNFIPESAPLTELADYIVNTHHKYVRLELPRITEQLWRVASKHGQHFPEMMEVAKLFEELKAEFELHMQKEETILFPRIKKLENLSLLDQAVKMDIPLLKSPILLMEHEHDHSMSVMAVIRKLTDNYNPPNGTCNTYKVVLAALETFEMDLHRHMHLENNILFPRALGLLAD